MLISKSRWQAIPADLRTTLTDVTKRYARQVVLRTRKENREALAVLEQQGIQIVDIGPEEWNRFLEVSRQVWERQAGRLYPRPLLDEVQSLLRQYRGESREPALPAR